MVLRPVLKLKPGNCVRLDGPETWVVGDYPRRIGDLAVALQLKAGDREARIELAQEDLVEIVVAPADP